MWYRNLKIRWKLLSGFGAVILLTLFLAIFGYIQLNRIDNEYSDLIDNVVTRSQSMLEVGRRYARYRRIATAATLRTGETEALNSLKNEYNTEKALVQMQFDRYLAALDSCATLSESEKADQSQLINEVRSKLNNDYDAIIVKIFENSIKGNQKGAMDALNLGANLSDGINGRIDELINSANDTLSTLSADATNNADMAQLLLILVAGIGILLGVIIAITIARIIRNGISAVTEAARKISQGNFNVSVGSDGKDEIAELSNSLLTLKTVIQDVASDINNAASDFDAGNTDYRMNVTAYNGEFQQIAAEINKTFEDLIDDSVYAAELVTEFGNGHFDIQIKELPGKKAVLSDSFKAVQANLKKINGEISHIINGATDGNLDVTIDATQFEGDWGSMASSINALLSAIVKPIREAIDVLNQLSNGQLNVSVDGDYRGEFAAMKSALNHTLSMLASYIKEISYVLNCMSNQDMTQSITREYVGEFNEIKTAINSIAETFNHILKEINAAADQVAIGSKQIAESSMQLAEGTSEQASSVEELNATIEDIAGQTQNNTQNAENANHLSKNAMENVEKGSNEMKGMLSAMEQINRSSVSISNIIKVIDDIAFQTNLLALNAAVEAARAGAHGKGFSVVAEEVRNLAAKSLNASKEISELIGDSVSRVSEGSKIAHETAESLEIIVKEIKEISGIASQVAQASTHQSGAIGQINIGLNQISTVTQSNSAASEEQASASQQLASQADLLKAMVNQFRL